MMHRVRYWPLLLAIVAIALAMRLLGINWDRGLYLHPDERFVTWVTTDLRWPSSIGAFLNTATSPLNPYNTDHGSFVYGTFPSFLVKAIAGVFDMDRYGDLHIVGRATSAVADTGTVLLSALIARRFFGQVASLLTAVLLAFTPLLLQSAHYFTVDTISLFFVVAAFLCVVRSWDKRSVAWALLAGVMIGLAGASKLNFLGSIAFLALPAAELVRTRGWPALLPRMNQRVYPAVPAMVVGALAAFWTFRIAQPYAFSGPYLWSVGLNEQWLSDLAFWRSAQTGLIDIKPSIQWVDRTPVVYLIENMVLWGMAPALGIASLAALVLAAWRVLRNSTWPSWWWLGMLGWIAANVVLFGTGIAQNQRYLMPIYPFLIVLAAGLLAELMQRLPRAWWPKAITILVVGYTVFYGTAMNSIFVRPITRIEASEWIYENVPEGSVLTHEYWDDALPIPLPERNRQGYTHITVDLYAQEFQDSTKVSTLVAQLSQVDYIVLSSNRIIDSVARQPSRYPVAVRYYEMLLSGELGFEPAAEFRQGPELLGLEWDDTGAEESLTVYEHPQVRIFRKTEAFNPQYVHDELLQAWGTGGYHWIPGDPTPQQMLLSTDAQATNTANGTFTDQVRESWWSNHPLMSWYLGLQLLALAAWPLTWRAFRNLPDAGFALAKGVGLLGIGAIVLALVSWRGMVFGPGVVLLAEVILAAIGFACPRCVWSGAIPALRLRWRGIVVGEVIFLAAFLLASGIRMHQRIQPDHQLMQLTGLMRSSSLPPADPWLSGGVLHTHWSPLLPWASLGRVLGLSPVVAYNLTIIGIVATLAVLAWGVVYALTRSFGAVLAPLLVVLAASTGFDGGLAPRWFSQSVDLPVLATLVIIATVIHVLVARRNWTLTQFGMLALITGALVPALGWGPLLALGLLAIGLALPAWLNKRSDAPWWPVVRSWVLTLVGAFALGVVIWLPAVASFTATARDFLPPQQLTINQLWHQYGVILILVAMVMVAGAWAVLAETMREGRLGIIASVIALTVAGLLIALSLVLDSGLVIIFVFSLLAVIAAWRWLHARAMLWTAALIMLAALLLIVAQARLSQNDIAGVQQAQQLLPVAWLQFTLALAIAAAYALKRSRQQQGHMLTVFGTVMLAIALMLPTGYSALDMVNEQPRSGLTAPRIDQSAPYAEAADWLEQNTAGMPVVLTAMAPDSQSTNGISSVTGFPAVLGSADAEQRMRPGWNAMIDRRQQDIHSIFTPGIGIEDALPLLYKYEVAYIVIGPTERAAYGDQVSLKFDAGVQSGHLQVVYESDSVTMYAVNPAARASGAVEDWIHPLTKVVRP